LIGLSLGIVEGHPGSVLKSEKYIHINLLKLGREHIVNFQI